MRRQPLTIEEVSLRLGLILFLGSIAAGILLLVFTP